MVVVVILCLVSFHSLWVRYVRTDCLRGRSMCMGSCVYDSHSPTPSGSPLGCRLLFSLLVVYGSRGDTVFDVFSLFVGEVRANHLFEVIQCVCGVLCV